jgi:hypothetical protein
MDDSVENISDTFSAIYAKELRASRTDIQGVESEGSYDKEGGT